MSSDSPAPRPTICLNMIVRNEAHIISESLHSAAAHIDYWVIVDTGSTDNTVATIERRMAEHGIPGELHHRRWQDFGTNRTEALRLAAGHADYTWVLDADDLVDGELDLAGLRADSYLLRYRVGHMFWRRQVFRSALPWRYEGVLHEYPTCDAPATEERLDGNYVILGRTVGARSADPKKYERDAELLRAVLDKDPDDLRTMFYLAQSLENAGDDAGALEAYTRRGTAGGWDEEQCVALIRRAECLQRLGRPWPESLASLLEAAEARPSRAEPLAIIARHYRETGEFELGYEFACRASAIPFPADDYLFVDTSVYDWRAVDERAVCAFELGRFAEALDLEAGLLAGTGLPDDERERVAANRDACVPQVRAARSTYPAEIVSRLASSIVGVAAPSADVTVTLAGSGDVLCVERTLDAFLHCVEDIDRIARFICLIEPDTRMEQALLNRYPFLEVIRVGGSHAAHMNRLRSIVSTPLWLNLTGGWEFFARGPHIDRAAQILALEPGVAQVAFNRSYAEGLGERNLVGGELRQAGGLRYRLHTYVPPDGPEWPAFRAALAPGERTNAHWPHFTVRPSLMSTQRIRTVGPFADELDFEQRFGVCFSAAGLHTAFFDDVICLLDELGDVPQAPLIELIPSVRIGQLDLDILPRWPVTAAAMAPAGSDALRLIVRTSLDSAAPLDYEVMLDAQLDIARIVALDRPVADVSGRFEVNAGAEVLRLEAVGAGMRFVRVLDGVRQGGTPPMSVIGAAQEQAFGLTRRDDQLLILFGVDQVHLGIAVVDVAAIDALIA
jgi:tetratricopeptide (TPR) repeat protein